MLMHNVYRIVTSGWLWGEQYTWKRTDDGDECFICNCWSSLASAD